MSECAEILERLLDDAKLYMEFIKPHRGEMKICVELADTGETATLVLGDKPQVTEGYIESSDGKVSMIEKHSRGKG